MERAERVLKVLSEVQWRELAFTDLKAALKLGLEMTLEHLNRQGNEVSPESREALAWLKQAVPADKA